MRDASGCLSVCMPPKSSLSQNWDYVVLRNVIPARVGGADSVQLFPGGVRGISFGEPKDGFK